MTDQAADIVADVTQRAEDAIPRACYWCRHDPQKTPGRTTEIPMPSDLSREGGDEVCPFCNQTPRQRLSEAVARLEEEQQLRGGKRDGIVQDRILANRARPANGGTMRTTEQQATATRAKELRRKRNDANRKRRQAMDRAQAHLGVAQQQGGR